MLILLFVFALIRHFHGAPITTPSTGDSDNLFRRDDSILNNHLGSRQISDILISCLATIFACTWSAIHPNIPDPRDSGWEIFKRQVTTMVYAILAPEAITGWALRQYLAARWITNHYNQQIGRTYTLVQESKQSWFHRKPLPPPLGKQEAVAWTVTHGFFLQMGGFMLCKDGQPIQTLDDGVYRHDIKSQIYEGNINPPSTTEAEIQDRSKGDGLTKGFLVLQTTWFIAQCIVRWSSSLPVTELEVVTLGFAMLNAITYGLWWNKPQSVGIPVYLEIKKSGATSRPERARDTVDETESTGTQQDPCADVQTAPLLKEAALLPLSKQRFLTRKLNDGRADPHHIYIILYRLIQASLRPLSRMMDFSTTKVDSGDLRVPMFYSGAVESNIVYVVSSGIASLFGLIHLIPSWFLHFPTHPQMLLWEVSAVIITLQPVIFAIWSWRTKGLIFHEGNRSSLIAYLCLFGLPLYIIARVTLIFLAFISLWSLDGNELVTVDWISFIPHI